MPERNIFYRRYSLSLDKIRWWGGSSQVSNPHFGSQVPCSGGFSTNPTPGFWSLKSLIWNNLMGLVVDVLLRSTEASAGRSYLRHALTHLASIARSGALCQVLKERKQYFVRPQHLSQHLRIRWSGH